MNAPVFLYSSDLRCAVVELHFVELAVGVGFHEQFGVGAYFIKLLLS